MDTKDVFLLGVAASLTASMIWKVYFDKENQGGNSGVGGKDIYPEPVVERYTKYNYVDPAQRSMIPSFEDFPHAKVMSVSSATNYLPIYDYLAPGGSKVRVRKDMGAVMGYANNTGF